MGSYITSANTLTTCDSTNSYTWRSWIESNVEETTENIWNLWTTTSTATHTTVVYDNTTSGTCADGAIWQNWHLVPSEARNTQIPAVTIKSPPPPAPRRLIELAKDEIRRRRDALKARRASRKAEQVATELLIELIGEEKRAEYLRTGRVYIQGRNHGYILKKEGHILQIETTGHIQELCVHVVRPYEYPGTDNLIALLLAFKFNEEATIKTANRHGHYHWRDCEDRQLQAAGLPAQTAKQNDPCARIILEQGTELPAQPARLPERIARQLEQAASFFNNPAAQERRNDALPPLRQTDQRGHDQFSGGSRN